MRPLLLLAAVTAAAALPAEPRAAPTVACHCFQDRTWNPAAPASSDPYVLATTRSSLLSAAFGVGKGALVRTAMGGTSADDLWVSYWAGARAGRPPEELLAAKRGQGSWKGALAGARGLGPAFDAALASGAPDAALSAIAVDDVLLGRLRANPEDVALLHAAGARSEEVVLAAVLALRYRAPAMSLLARVRAGQASWSSIVHDAGLEPREMDGLVRSLVR